ncbi:MAG: DUF2461 domain-containing protein [Streptosporangiales bacterium]|nr:DUF2461 domain-containing protein [Streptosporangiales bacterium]
MGFNGWTDEALRFYEGLEADNSKSYWTSHKRVYDEQVRRPMEELAETLAGEFGEAKIFRPYRDIRFSHDKTPYKTHIGAVIGGTGYVQLSADGLAVGAGRWRMEPDELARYRAAVADDHRGSRLSEIVAALEKNGVEIQCHGELKTAPRGYKADHPRIRFLRCKGLTSWQWWAPEPWLHTAAAADRVTAFLRTSADLVSWLDANAGD